ncbi:hypothetical protein LIA77_09127 [Sarocladium implicatum]|nr:hypothetical protein LIA77_09127 [Sarocladium implicatum]
MVTSVNRKTCIVSDRTLPQVLQQGEACPKPVRFVFLLHQASKSTCQDDRKDRANEAGLT